MRYVKGPDFPTGGIIQGLDIKKAYKTGRGKIVVRAKTEISDLKGGKKKIEITELPYEVVKSNLVSKIDAIRLNKEVAGIAEVRDESDREGCQLSLNSIGNQCRRYFDLFVQEDRSPDFLQLQYGGHSWPTASNGQLKARPPSIFGFP